MKPKQRWLILGGLLLATLAAGYLIDDEPLPEKAMTRNGARAHIVASTGDRENRRVSTNDRLTDQIVAPLSFPEPAVVAGAVRGTEKGAIDPFRNKSWLVAPPSPRPVAPPLPFKYLGKFIEDGEIRVFLQHQGKYLIARTGDVINGTYTVEEISGNRMTFLYQPLKEKQVFPIGADN